ADQAKAGAADDLTSEPARHQADEQNDQQTLVRHVHNEVLTRGGHACRGVTHSGSDVTGRPVRRRPDGLSHSFLADRYVAATVGGAVARMRGASRPGPRFTFGGGASLQRGCARLQRGAKEQARGARSSEGGVPGMVCSRSPRLAPWMVE